MKYYIIAGEASGDLHGSNLMKALKDHDSNAEFRFWGGDLMLHESENIRKHYKDMAFMGFVEVVVNLRKILGNLSDCKHDLLANRPDALILVDFPGFNLKIAEMTPTTIAALDPKPYFRPEGSSSSLVTVNLKEDVSIPFSYKYCSATKMAF